MTNRRKPDETRPLVDDVIDDDADDVLEAEPGPAAESDIHERLAWAQGQVRRVEKRGRNNDQKYDYAKAEDVYAMVRPILAAAGISYIVAMNDRPVLEETGQETSRGLKYQRWWVSVTILLRCPESPKPPLSDPEGREVPQEKANEIRLGWTCVADDYSDKGAAKAITLGLKSWIMATFMVSSGQDDAEATDRQAGVTQRAGTRGDARAASDDDTPHLTPLASAERKAFAAARSVEAEFGPAKAVEITRVIAGVHRIKDVKDVEKLNLLTRAFDAYRTQTDGREERDRKMAAKLAEDQDAAAEGPARQEPRLADRDMSQPLTAEAPFNPETEPPPASVAPPPTVAEDEQGTLA